MEISVAAPAVHQGIEESTGESSCEALALLRESIGLRRFATVDGHALYRSRQLNNLSATDVEALCELGIVDVYDLRKPAERAACERPSCAENPPFRLQVISGDLQGDPLRTQLHRAQNIARAYGLPGERMTNLYAIMARHGDLLREAIDPLLHPTAPALVHCVNGKDRTGIVCACIQRLMGFDSTSIVQDYLVTNQLNAPMNQRDLAALAKRLEPDGLAVMAAMFEARTVYLEAFWQTIEEEYGSFEAFMQ
ncbi:MAG: tyrosine-protein phosphatase [Gordonibacter sp.]|uniref:tyrosine-protein phosphatase n=1 Tax=Gordonibacter sp. TaxID=1968902 RepID=UPI002FC75BE3